MTEKYRLISDTVVESERQRRWMQTGMTVHHVLYGEPLEQLETARESGEEEAFIAGLKIPEPELNGRLKVQMHFREESPNPRFPEKNQDADTQRYGLAKALEQRGVPVEVVMGVLGSIKGDRVFDLGTVDSGRAVVRSYLPETTGLGQPQKCDIFIF